MENRPRYLLFAVLFVAGIVATYWMVYQKRPVEMNHYMNLLGQQLLAMVPEGEDKSRLADSYGDLVSRVDKREIPPEQVERIAAGILNARNAKENLTAEQAEAVLSMTLPVPHSDSLLSAKAPLAVPEAQVDEWEKAANRLKIALEFNEKMYRNRSELALQDPEIPRSIQFKVQNGLKIVIDNRFREEVEKSKIPEVKIEIEKLEALKLIHWENLQDLEEHMTRLGDRLENIEVKLENLPGLDVQKISVEAVEMLRLLDSLGMPIPVNVDSIIMEVEKELEKAGVGIEKQKKK